MRMKRYRWGIIQIMLFLLLGGAVGCRDSAEDRIPKDLMVNLYAEVLILTSMREDTTSLRAYSEMLDSLLHMHGETFERFSGTLDYYRDDPVRWKNLLDRVTEELERRRRQRLESSS
jgi:hypothetical protein